MSHSVFRIDQLLAYYHCNEFFRYKQNQDKEQEGKALLPEGLLDYMSGMKTWANRNIYSEESQFFGGEDEDVQIVLYSSTANVFVPCFAVRTASGQVEPIFFSKMLPKAVKDSHLLSVCVAMQALRDLGLVCNRAWLTTGTEHLPIVPAQENFEILERVCKAMNADEYQVKTGGKCRFCPIKDTCEVYDNIEQVKSLCTFGPAKVNFWCWTF